MITTTQAYKDKILSDHREMKMKVIFNGRQEIDGHYLKNVTIHEVSNGLDTLTIGGICSNSIKIDMFDPGNIPFEGGSLEAFIGIQLASDIEWVPMGSFFISEITRNNDYEVSLEGYDGISLLNDELLEKYLNQQMKQEDIQKVISLRQMFPVFFGSALKDEGVEEFMEALDLYTCQKEALDILSGIVFKKTFHKQKHLTHLKVTGGTLHVKDVISESKVDELRIYTGQGYQSVQSASTGDIVACLGLDELPIGFTFGNQKQTQVFVTVSYYFRMQVSYASIERNC